MRDFLRGFFLMLILNILFSFFIFDFSFSQEDLLKKKEELELQLKKIEEEIFVLEKEKAKITSEKTTLQNQINLLNKKIQSLELEIKKTNLLISDLNIQILETESSLNVQEKEMQKTREKIKNILREIFKEEKKSTFEILLGGKSLSDFFNNLFNLQFLSQRTQKTLKELNDLKESLEKTKNVLEERQDEMENLLKIKELQKMDSSETKKEKINLLNVTKGKEQEYQKILSQKEKEAQEIRKRIFELVGISEAPTFEKAYELAKYVESITNVRSAFLLAILKQESDLGKNTGQCYLTDLKTGQGKRVLSGNFVNRVMKPSQIPLFLDITSKLGLDWKEVRVSCPMSFGWGGAMGPAQFIPSTWRLYEDKLREILNKEPNPWTIKDAFLAAGLYLKDLGASSQKYQDEWRAALKYFSGGTNLKYSFYANSVMALTNQFEQDIKIITGNIFALLFPDVVQFFSRF
ncbi:MAG: lytic murein transglycosylase [Minisyncoccales bacterium]